MTCDQDRISILTDGIGNFREMVARVGLGIAFINLSVQISVQDSRRHPLKVMFGNLLLAALM